MKKAKFLKNGFLTAALMTVILLFAVSVVPVNAADNNVTSTPESIGSGTGFVAPLAIAVEADGNLVVADPALEAVVRVNPISGNRTIVSGASTGQWIVP